MGTPGYPTHCSILAHQQGATLKLSKQARALGIDGIAARHYIDLLEGLYLVHSLPPLSRKAGKRLVESRKFYWRDTGLLHALVGRQSKLQQVMCCQSAHRHHSWKNKA